MRRNKKQITDAQYLNYITWLNWYNYLKLIVLNVVKWNNVPDSIDQRFLELTLCEKGIAVFFQDDILKDIETNNFICLPVCLSGEYNVYGIPVNYYAYSPATNYQNRELDRKNSVLIWNNYLRSTNELIIQTYATRLTNIRRSRDVNVSAQRTPVLVGCSEQQKLTMRNLVAQYDGNEPFIYLSDKLDLSNIKVFNTQAPYVADKLETLEHNVINDFLSCFGIENANADKRERMVSDEVNANYGQIEISRNILLNPRRQACEKINKMFGLNISVEINSELRTLINAPQISQQEGDVIE